MDAEQICREYPLRVRDKKQDPRDAEDPVFAVFMKVVKKLDSYDPAKASVFTWVDTITRSTVADFFRNRAAWLRLRITCRRNPLRRTMRWII